ncbi:MAG: sugar transferase [Clostridia bacterium]|nr:sugar transferase [Clostridia bacterium]
MYKRAQQGWAKHLDFMLLDVLCLHLAFWMAYVIRHGMGVSPYTVSAYRGLVVVMTVADLCAAILFDSMKQVLRRGWYIELAQTVKHSALVFGILVIYMFSLQTSVEYSRIVLYLTLGLHIVFGFAVRVLWKKWLRRKGGLVHQRAMLVVADAATAESMIGSLKERTDEAYRITGVVIPGVENGSVLDVPVVCSVSEAAGYICREWVDEVLFAVDQPTPETEKLLSQCREMGVVIHEVLELQNEAGHHRFLEKIGSYQVLTSSVNFATPMQATLKRLMDIFGSIAGLLLTGVVALWIGPKIKKESPGPIFFTQERVGKNGKRFRMVKFRSMHLDAEERKQALQSQNRISDGMMFKLDFDPRIIGNEILPDGSTKTGIGDFIRRTSLDEFPQFWNVLKGDMSLVGTRPPTVDEWEKYELHHRARLATKPGITGMWQVSGRSQITDFEEVVKLDTQYIYNWSMGLDLRILLQTVKSVLGRDGAL